MNANNAQPSESKKTAVVYIHCYGDRVSHVCYNPEDRTKMVRYLRGKARQGFYIGVVRVWPAHTADYGFTVNLVRPNTTWAYIYEHETPGSQYTTHYGPVVRVCTHGHRGTRHIYDYADLLERVQTVQPEPQPEPETVQDLQPEFKQELLGVLSKFMSLSIDLDADDNDNLANLATLRGLFALATNSTLADALDVTRETMNNPPDWAIKRTQVTAPEDPADVPAEDVPAGVSMSLDGGPVEVVAIWEDPNGSRWAEVRLNNVGPSEWWRLVRIQHVGGDKRAWRAWTTCDFRRAMVGRVVWGVA